MPPRPGASRGVRTQLIVKRTSAEPAVPRTCPRGHRLLCGAATSAVFVPASPHGTPEMPPRTGASRCVRTLSTIERVPALSLHQVARESRGGSSSLGHDNLWVPSGSALTVVKRLRPGNCSLNLMIRFDRGLKLVSFFDGAQRTLLRGHSNKCRNCEIECKCYAIDFA